MMRTIGLGLMIIGIAVALYGLGTPEDIAPSQNIPFLAGIAITAFGLIVAFVGMRNRIERAGNAPTGTDSKASRIGRAAPSADADDKANQKSDVKWGRGED